MNMVGHQNIGIDSALAFNLSLPQAFQIVQVIIIRKEDGLAIVAALNDMVRISWNNKPRFSGHRKTLPVYSLSEYLIMCSRYIELNPVRARLVKDAGEYRWSSYRFRAMGEPTRILDEDVWYAGLGETLDKRQRIYGEWLIHSLREGEWDEVREATHKGSVIGQKRFQEEIELMLGRRVARKPGRPKKEGAASIKNVL